MKVVKIHLFRTDFTRLNICHDLWGLLRVVEDEHAKCMPNVHFLVTALLRFTEKRFNVLGFRKTKKIEEVCRITITQ